MIPMIKMIREPKEGPQAQAETSQWATPLPLHPHRLRLWTDYGRSGPHQGLRPTASGHMAAMHPWGCEALLLAPVTMATGGQEDYDRGPGTKAELPHHLGLRLE